MKLAITLLVLLMTKFAFAIDIECPPPTSFNRTYINGQPVLYCKAQIPREDYTTFEVKHGPFYELYGNDAIKLKGQYEKDKPTGNWQYLSPEGEVLAEDTFENIKSKAAKIETEAKAKSKEKKLAQEKENQLKLDKLKANWANKKIGSTAAFLDKLAKVTWTENVGYSNWLNATLKCKKLGLRLPTSSELKTSMENGLLNYVENPNSILWTKDDKASVTNAQLDMILGNGDALVVASDGSVFPNKKSLDAGVICIKR